MRRPGEREWAGFLAWVSALAVGLTASVSVPLAEVPETSGQGFVVVQERQIAAPPGRVWEGLVGIGDWWHPDHTYTGSSKNLRLDPSGDGCFCEKLPDRGLVRHMTVVYAEPGVRLRMSGGLGPLQSLAVAGSMTFDLEAADGDTVLRLVYKVAGWDPEGLQSLAGAVDQVLGLQLDRLTRFIEAGDPAP